MKFLHANKEVFAWEPDQLVGVPRGVIEHHLKVCPNVRHVKQRAQRQSMEKQTFIVQETRKLEAARAIREVRYPEWLANPVVVPKKGGKERMCLDFTNLNKACPQDPFPLPRMDQIVDSTAECDLLCFLDAFSGYHQIKMAVEDVEKTASRPREGCTATLACLSGCAMQAQPSSGSCTLPWVGSSGGTLKPASTTSW